MQPKGIIKWGTKASTQVLNIDGQTVSYTSLRDVMPTLVVNCKPGAVHEELVCHVIPRTPIKNHLVEKAARAYLQPTVVEQMNKSEAFTNFWNRIFSYRQFALSVKDFFRGPLEAFTAFVYRMPLLDLSQAVQYFMAQLQLRTFGLLQVQKGCNVDFGQCTWHSIDSRASLSPVNIST